ncbi:MAG: hypothetical protein QNL68_11055, partial [Akkermansiaceae bacterium]
FNYESGVLGLRSFLSSGGAIRASYSMTHGDDKGFIRFDPLGGYHPKTLSAQRVVVHGSKDVIGVMGSKPIHIMSPEERAKNPKLEGTSGNLISEKSPKFPHLSVGHKPYEFIQKAR